MRVDDVAGSMCLSLDGGAFTDEAAMSRAPAQRDEHHQWVTHVPGADPAAFAAAHSPLEQPRAKDWVYVR